MVVFGVTCGRLRETLFRGQVQDLEPPPRFQLGDPATSKRPATDTAGGE